MAGRIYHWKHGWIPLDQYARDVASGKIKAAHGPGGIPQRPFKDEKNSAVAASEEMQKLVPGLGAPKPELVKKNDWIINTHYSGALKLSPDQADRLIKYLDLSSEYPAPPHLTRMRGGQAGLQGSTPYTRSRDRARLISGAVKGSPPIYPDLANKNGGVDIPAESVEPVLAHLRSVASPAATYDRAVRAASGAAPGFLPLKAKVRHSAPMPPTAKRPAIGK